MIKKSDIDVTIREIKPIGCYEVKAEVVVSKGWDAWGDEI